jgi:hypothetical protein
MEGRGGGEAQGVADQKKTHNYKMLTVPVIDVPKLTAYQVHANGRPGLSDFS